MKKTLISLTAIFMAGVLYAMPVMADAGISRYFIDLNQNTYGFWAVDEVDSLVEKGVVKGIGDNRFAPEMLMKRGDFVLMLENAFKYPAISANMYSFTDVPGDKYYAQAIVNARGNGIIPNDPTFNPEKPIKRVDAFNMLFNTLNLYGAVGTAGSTDVSMYKDSALLLNVKDKIAVGTLTKLGILAGSNGMLKPNDTVTRAEMAVMLSNTLKIYEESGSNGAALKVTQVEKPVISGAEAKPDPDKKKEETTKVTETYVVPKGEEAQLKSADVFVEGADGAVAKGLKTVLKVTGGKSGTAGEGTKVFSAVDGGRLEITNTNISVGDKDSVGVYVDENGSAQVNATKIMARYKDCVGLKNEGSVEIKDSVLQGVDGDAMWIYGNSVTDVISGDFKAEGKSSAIRVKNNRDNYDTATLNLTDVHFSGEDCDSAILVENAKTVVNFKNVTFEGFDNILRTTHVYERGMMPTDVEINLDNEHLVGRIDADEMTVVKLKLSNGSVFEGSLNPSNVCRGVSLSLDKGCEVILTDNCYIDALVFEDKDIEFNRNFSDYFEDRGNVIYYNADNYDNYYLNEDTYYLRNGGELRPYNR